MIRPTFLLLLVLPLAACGGDTPDSGDEQALAPANQGTASPGTGAQGDGLSPQSNDPIADQRGE